MTTINDLCVVSSFSGDDKLPMWQNANGVTRALPLSVLTASFLTPDAINQFAASPTVESFSAGSGFTPGTTTALTLANSYLSGNNIEVFFDSAFQGPDQYSLSNTTLVFISPIPVGVQKVYVRGGSTRLTAAPSDGTITDVKVANGSKLLNRIKNRVDVKDFGALGDGATDDSAAIQAAVNYALTLTGGTRIYVPPGRYIINTAIQIPKNTAKALILYGDGSCSIFQAGPSLPSGAIFNLGAGSTAAGGVDMVVKSLSIQPQAGLNHTGFVCLNMNGIIFDKVNFGALQNGVTLNACFATRFVGCQWLSTVLYAIYSYTAAHNIILDRCSAFAVGLNVLKIDGATNNIVIQNCDFESCGNVYQVAAASSSIRVTGCYIEYTVNKEFYHVGLCYNVTIEGNWLALNGGGSGAGLGGGTVTYQNWAGGSFKNNTGFNMTVAWDAATVSNVDVGANYNAGSFTLGAAPFSSVAFLNNWTAGTHTVGYKKFENGLVEIRGNCTAGTSSLGNAAFQLPVGLRPSQQKVFACFTNSNTLAQVIVDTNGNVAPNVPGGSVGVVVNLDGCMFNASPQ